MVRAISPPATRIPVCSRSARRPARSPAGSGSSSHSTPSSASSAGEPPDGGQVQGGRDVAGHPPPLVQVDHDVHAVADRLAGGPHRGQPGRRRPRRPMRIFTARKPAARAASAASARAAGALQLAERGVGAAGCRRPRRTARTPAARPPGRRCPTARPPAASSGPAWKPIVSMTAACRAICSGSRPRNRLLERLEAVHGVAGAVPGHALVGLHPDQGGVERGRAAPGPRPRGTAGPAAAASGPAGWR